VAARLRILAPLDGDVVEADTVTVRGVARPGSVITRDIPVWPDQHVSADASGRWTMVVGLQTGDNVLRFRIADDRTTEIALHITTAAD
jgi:hypothetical protein